MYTYITHDLTVYLTEGFGLIPESISRARRRAVSNDVVTNIARVKHG